MSPLVVLGKVEKDPRRVPHEGNKGSVGLFLGFADLGVFVTAVPYNTGRVLPPCLGVAHGDVHHEIVRPVFVVVVLKIEAVVGELQLGEAVIVSPPVD